MKSLWYTVALIDLGMGSFRSVITGGEGERMEEGVGRGFFFVQCLGSVISGFLISCRGGKGRRWRCGFF